MQSVTAASYLPSLFHEALAHHTLHRICCLGQGLVAVQDLHDWAANSTQECSIDVLHTCVPL